MIMLSNKVNFIDGFYCVYQNIIISKNKIID